MKIDQTYCSFNVTDDINIFIETFDGYNFSINMMRRSDLDMETIAMITATTTDELNKKITEVINRRIR